MFMPPIMGAGGFIMGHYETRIHNLMGEKSEHGALDIIKTQGY